MGIKEVVTALRSPWQNPYVERVIGSIRRECLDHIVIFNERHLRRVLSWYVEYYQRTRTHLSLEKGCRDPRPIMPRRIGKVIAISQSAACIIATNATPPDSSLIPAHQWLRSALY
ncbi:integrase core domain-containing protein, partial [Candidatus Binatus sp.]